MEDHFPGGLGRGGGIGAVHWRQGILDKGDEIFKGRRQSFASQETGTSGVHSVNFGGWGAGDMRKGT